MQLVTTCFYFVRPNLYLPALLPSFAAVLRRRRSDSIPVAVFGAARGGGIFLRRRGGLSRTGRCSVWAVKKRRLKSVGANEAAGGPRQLLAAVSRCRAEGGGKWPGKRNLNLYLLVFRECDRLIGGERFILFLL